MGRGESNPETDSDSAAIEVKFSLHDGQRRVAESDAPIKVVLKGRQWGGSSLLIYEAITTLVDNPGRDGWIFAPSERIARSTWELVGSVFPEGPFTDMGRGMGSPIIELQNGSVLRFRGASSVGRVHRKLRGSPTGDGESKPPAFVGLDEADMIPQDAAGAVYRAVHGPEGGEEIPELTMLVGTPEGYAEPVMETRVDHTGTKYEVEYPGSWMYERFTEGFQYGTGVESWQFPAATNPLVDPAALDGLREASSEAQAAQEYDARWL